MEELFFDETIHESKIDNFIKDHPVILENSLNLIKPIHQPKLLDIHGHHDQDLIPDVIAFNINDKIWSIVDYKRAKRKILKSRGKVRIAPLAEVTELQSQLRDYKDYFDDTLQRRDFEKKNGVEIKYPNTIGIIGHVRAEEEDEFNKVKRDFPQWFTVIPYNRLYKSFCRYFDMAKDLIGKGPSL